MHYCGIVPAGKLLQLVMLEEELRPEPPIRLASVFFEPGSADQIAAELRALGEVVIGIGAPITGEPATGERDCDHRLRARGAPLAPGSPEGKRLGEELGELGIFAPAGADHEGQVSEGAFREAPVFETGADAVFCALQGRRVPAKRHPHGMQLRISELLDDHVLDDGGDLWHRRIEEVDAAAAALCAHRYAVGHASWIGDPSEGVIVLPGTSLPVEFTSAGVLEPVERLQLPPVTGRN
jgi:predicted nuclease with RNAse H fold